MAKRTLKGFTLVEIMIVVAIIALLAVIAIPNLLRAQVASNDALAKATLRAISTASETFAANNRGTYPTAITSLTGGTPAYLNSPYCGAGAVSGYIFTCTMATSGYTVAATPLTVAFSGTTTYTITTGGILLP